MLGSAKKPDREINMVGEIDEEAILMLT